MLTRRDMVAGMAASAALPAKAYAASSGRLFRQVPKSGERIPIVGLGTYIALDVAPNEAAWPDAAKAVNMFISGGGRVIDTSPMYGRAEAAVGALLGDKLKSRAFLATKVWVTGQERGRQQIERSFANLQADKIDLVQVHNLLDISAHLPTLRALKEQGRIRYIGVTHYHSGGYAALENAMRTGLLDFIQVNYSVAERGAEARILPFARDNGIAVIANRPFAGGSLFGRVRSQPLPSWAKELGCASWGQLLLKFILADSSITCAIPGTRNPKHVLDNLGAASPPLPNAAMRRRILEAVRSF